MLGEKISDAVVASSQLLFNILRLRLRLRLSPCTVALHSICMRNWSLFSAANEEYMSRLDHRTPGF